VAQTPGAHWIAAAACPAQRIAQAMRGIDGVDVPVGILDITLYRDDLSKVAPGGPASSDIKFGVDGMDLVLVDDVLYTDARSGPP